MTARVTKGGTWVQRGATFVGRFGQGSCHEGAALPRRIIRARHVDEDVCDPENVLALYALSHVLLGDLISLVVPLGMRFTSHRYCDRQHTVAEAEVSLQLQPIPRGYWFGVPPCTPHVPTMHPPCTYQYGALSPFTKCTSLPSPHASVTSLRYRVWREHLLKALFSFFQYLFGTCAATSWCARHQRHHSELRTSVNKCTSLRSNTSLLSKLPKAHAVVGRPSCS